MSTNERKQNSAPQSSSKRIGIDQAAESERRYGNIPVARTADQKIKERETDFQDRNIEKQRVSEVDDKLGYGSKTEGAFGKEHDNVEEKMNTRYRPKHIDNKEKQ